VAGELALHGVAASGLGKASGFTEIAWVREEFARKLDFNAYPGTFNVRLVEPESLARWKELTGQPGIEIEPPHQTACVARCYPVLLAERLLGAIILPHVADYPPDQVEVLTPVSVRGELGLQDGDPVTLRQRAAAKP
jgi:CTP-dependent riboflavin kinase